MIVTILLILAFASFVAAAANIPGRVNWVGLGLALWIAVQLFGRVPQ